MSVVRPRNWSSQFLLRLVAIGLRPSDRLLVIRERVKRDTRLADSAVDFGIAPRAVVVGASCGCAIGDEGLEGWQATYYHSYIW